MREDKALANRFLRQQGSIESIRKEIEARITIPERISTSVEVPLSGVQAQSLICGGRSGAPRPQARRHRASAPRHLARRKVLRRGNLDGARPAAFTAAGRAGRTSGEKRGGAPRKLPARGISRDLSKRHRKDR